MPLEDFSCITEGTIKELSLAREKGETLGQEHMEIVFGNKRNIGHEVLVSVLLFALSIPVTLGMVRILTTLYSRWGTLFIRVSAGLCVGTLAVVILTSLGLFGTSALGMIIALAVAVSALCFFFVTCPRNVFEKLGELLSYGATVLRDIPASRFAALVTVVLHVFVFALFRMTSQVALAEARPEPNHEVADVAVVESTQSLKCFDLSGHAIACCQRGSTGEGFPNFAKWLSYFVAYWITAVAVLALQAAIGRVVEEHVCSPQEATSVGRELVWRAGRHVLTSRFADLSVAGMVWAAAARCMSGFENWVLHLGHPAHVNLDDVMKRESLLAALAWIISYFAWEILAIAAAVLGMSEGVTFRTSPPAATLTGAVRAVWKLLRSTRPESIGLMLAPLLLWSSFALILVVWWLAMTLLLFLITPLVPQPTAAFVLAIFAATLLSLSGPWLVVLVVLPAMNSRFVLEHVGAAAAGTPLQGSTEAVRKPQEGTESTPLMTGLSPDAGDGTGRERV